MLINSFSSFFIIIKSNPSLDYVYAASLAANNQSSSPYHHSLGANGNQSYHGHHGSSNSYSSSNSNGGVNLNMANSSDMTNNSYPSYANSFLNVVN